MKKLLCITLAAIMCMSFAACQEGNNSIPTIVTTQTTSDTITPTTPTETTNNTKNEIPKIIEYTIYSSPDGFQAIDTNKATTQKLDLKSASELNMEVPLEKNSFDDSMDGKKITFELFGKETSAVYYSNVNRNLSNSKNKVLKKQSVLYRYDVLDSAEEQKIADVYFAENDTKPVEYRVSSFQYEKGNLTEEEAKVKAEEFMESYLGKAFTDNYVLSSSLNDTNSYLFTYIVRLHNVNTSEKITIRMDTAGNVVSFVFRLHGLFDECKEEITEERLDAAFEKLNSVFPGDVTKSAHEIKMDYETGIPYLHASTMNADFYINIY